MPERAMEETAAAVKRPMRSPEPAPHAHVSAPGAVWDAGAYVPGTLSAVLAIQRAAGNQAVMRMLDARRPGHPLAGPSTAVQRSSEVELDDDEDVQRDAAALHEPSDAAIRSAAAEGVRTPSTTLPYLDRIQASFGRHSIAHVQAHIGPEAARASRAMNALAYASGDHVVFGTTPDLRTAAHEAAHVVQQQAGVQLSGGIGRASDPYEQHADAVADAVVAGRSVEAVLEADTASAGTKDLGVPVRERTLDTALLVSPPTRILPPVQRTVSKHPDEERYSSDKAPDTWFPHKEQAEVFEKIWNEIDQLHTDGILDVLGKSPPAYAYVARLQTVVSQRPYPSWVPRWIQEYDGTGILPISDKLSEAANDLTKKREYTRQTRPSANDALAYCVELTRDGFTGAATLEDGIRTKKDGKQAGDIFAVHAIMIDRSKYELLRVEPAYGIPKPGSSNRFRADAELLCVNKQDAQDSYYPPEQERYTLKVREYKIGYGDQLAYERDLKEQFYQYAGAGEGLPAGGLDLGKSQEGREPRTLEYVWYLAPPTWVERKMRDWLRDIRNDGRQAFAGGLTLNGKTITHSSKEVSRLAKEAGEIYSDIVTRELKLGVHPQSTMEGWDEVEDFNDWKLKSSLVLADLIQRKLAREIPELSRRISELVTEFSQFEKMVTEARND